MTDDNQPAEVASQSALLAEKRNLRGSDLRGRKFKRQDLRETDFTGAGIRGADFRGAKLGAANFIGVTAGRPWLASLVHLAVLFAVVAGMSVLAAHFLSSMLFLVTSSRTPYESRILVLAILLLSSVEFYIYGLTGRFFIGMATFIVIGVVVARFPLSQYLQGAVEDSRRHSLWL